MDTTKMFEAYVNTVAALERGPPSFPEAAKASVILFRYRIAHVHVQRPALQGGTEGAKDRRRGEKQPHQ